MPLYAGVDAGGTRTRVLVVSADGVRWGVAVGGAGNFQQVGARALATAIVELIDTACRQSGLAPGPPSYLCAGVAGAGRPDEQAALRHALLDARAARQVRIVSDARIALEGAHGGAPGIVCIAGTGSMVLGRDTAGEQLRAGGWGPILGDEGSACWLVLEGLRAALRARDGAGPETCLTGDLLGPLGLATWDEVVALVYGAHLPRERIAAASPALLAAADGGDPVAADILRRGLDGLAGQVAAVAGRLRLTDPVPVACAGGIFAADAGLQQSLAAAARRRGVVVRVGAPRLPAVVGAVLRAAAAAGAGLPAPLLAAWESDPPS